MGFASTVGQAFFIIIFMMVFAQMYVIQHRQNALQTELFSYQQEKLSQTSGHKLQLLSAHYNTTFNTTNFAVLNIGSESYDMTKSEFYIGDLKFTRDYTSRKFSACTYFETYRCGEIRFGDNVNAEETSLLLLYHMNNDSNFGGGNLVENYATTLNSNDLTPTGLITNESGKFGRAFQFDGVSSRATRANTAQNAFTNTTSYTWSFWIYPTSYPNAAHTIVSKNAAATGYSISISPTGTLQMISSNTNKVHSATRTIPLNTWTHVGIVYTGTTAGTVAFYINGTLSNTVTHTSAFRSDSGTYTIGRNDSTSTDYYTGLIDEFAQYNAAKTAQQILALYRKGIFGGNIDYFEPGEILEIDAYRTLTVGNYNVVLSTSEGASVSSIITV